MGGKMPPTLGVEKKNGSTPQPKVQSWQMKVLFFWDARVAQK